MQEFALNDARGACLRALAVAAIATAMAVLGVIGALSAQAIAQDRHALPVGVDSDGCRILTNGEYIAMKLGISMEAANAAIMNPGEADFAFGAAAQPMPQQAAPEPDAAPVAPAVEPQQGADAGAGTESVPPAQVVEEPDPTYYSEDQAAYEYAAYVEPAWQGYEDQASDWQDQQSDPATSDASEQESEQQPVAQEQPAAEEQPVAQEQPVQQEPVAQEQPAQQEGSSSDKESFVNEWGARIDAYLEGSELAGYGSTFASAAYDNNVDPRWSPAIATVESGKGEFCFLENNAWGWGSSSWDSWEEAINDHVEGLATGYGYTLDYESAQTYCPPNADEWYEQCASEMESI